MPEISRLPRSNGFLTEFIFVKQAGEEFFVTFPNETNNVRLSALFCLREQHIRVDTDFLIEQFCRVVIVEL